MKRASFKISIIIPTLNEEKYIESCISTALRNAKNPIEIIVIDAGSTDNTLSILSTLSNVNVWSDSSLKGFKYASLNTGASKASGDILLFLDADTALPKGYDELIIKSIQSGYCAGAFNLKFDKANELLRSVAFLNFIRYSLTKRFFGDQAIFCSKDLFHKVNGFPKIRILESAYFCQNLKSITKLKLIPKAVITSGRRFEHQGVMKVFYGDLKILFKDVLNMNLAKEGEEYWNEINR